MADFLNLGGSCSLLMQENPRRIKAAFESAPLRGARESINPETNTNMGGGGWDYPDPADSESVIKEGFLNVG